MCAYWRSRLALQVFCGMTAPWTSWGEGEAAASVFQPRWSAAFERSLHSVFQLLEAERHIDRLAVDEEGGCGPNTTLHAGPPMLLHPLRIDPVGHFGVEADHVQADRLRVPVQGRQRQ